MRRPTGICRSSPRTSPGRLALGDLAETLFDAVSTTPDPDAALVGFCRYVAARTPKGAFIGTLSADPNLLGILTQIFGPPRS